MRNISILIALACYALAADLKYTVNPFAGSDWVGDGGLSRDSLLLQAEGLATDRDGNVYIADAQAHRIRRIRPNGIIDTIAGTGVAGFSGDEGPAALAQINAPYGLTAHPSGELYFADLGNRRVRKIARDGNISTVAVGFVTPRNVAADAAGDLYVSDFDANRLYKITPAGVVSIVIDSGLDHPAGLAVDRAGTLYIGDTGSHSVLKFQNGNLTKVSAALAATGLAVDASNKLYIADTGGAAGTLLARDVAISSSGILYTTDGRLVRRHLSNITTVIAGRGDSARGDHGPALEARLSNPAGLALDRLGRLYIADRDNHRIRRVDLEGVITTFAGTGLAGNSGDNGPATAAALNSPTTLSFDESGNLYVSDQGNKRIRMIDTVGVIQAARSMPVPNADDGNGNRYFIDGNLRIAREDSAGAVSFLALSSPISLPTAVIPGPNGVLYVADAAQDLVWLLTPAVLPPDPITQIHVPEILAPNMIATIEGIRVANPEVFFDGAPARILQRTESSLTILVPPQLLPGAAELQIFDGATPLAGFSITIAPAAPRIFAAVNEDGSLNDPDHPAARGSIATLYGTGQGVEAQVVQVRFGNYEAEVLYSGSVEQYPGLWQLNVRVPGGFIPVGAQPLTVTVGQVASRSVEFTIN